MNHFLTIWSIITFIEKRIKTKIPYAGLEKAAGFSLAHIRDIFARHTGRPLHAYVVERKIANAAFEICHTDQTITAVADSYGFSGPDTFTRAFRRVTGLTPSAFRKKKIPVGRIKLCAGVYGVGFLWDVKKMKGFDANE